MNTQDMNVYQKLQKCRSELQKVVGKKGGRNDYSNYNYFELKDFLPGINDLFDQYGLFSTFNLDPEAGLAVLTIRNSEKPDQAVVFTSPYADAPLKGATPIQTIGSQNTYMRRYLYMNALEIVENDKLEAATGNPEKQVGEVEKPAAKAKKAAEPKKEEEPKRKATDGQVMYLNKLVEAGKIDKEKLLAYYKVKDFTELDLEVASDIIKKRGVNNGKA